MPFATLTDLQTSVLTWLERVGDATATALVSDWIVLAETELRLQMRMLRVRLGETNNEAFTLDSEYTDLPADLIGIRLLRLNGQPTRELQYLAPSSVEWRTDRTATTARPFYYTIQGNKIRLLNAPDQSYTATLSYFALPALSVGAPSNWLLLNYPNIYLAATLAEAHDYYQDVQRRTDKRAEVSRMLSDLTQSDSGGAAVSSLTVAVRGATP